MKLLLLGDVCPTEENFDLWKAQNIKKLFGNTEIYEKHDHIFVNLECAITQSQNKILKFGPHLAAPYETAKVLKEIGVTCCGLSNNHVFDFGVEGIEDTMKALDECGIAYTGFGMNYEDSRKNYVIEQNGERVCLIAVCEHEYSYALEDRMGSRPYDPYDTVEDVRRAAEQYDRVVVLYHGGKEYSRFPSPRLRRLCRKLVENGADAVLCQHSHCIGCFENYKNGHILYGQGNFHFIWQNRRESWYTSLAVSYDTEKNDMYFIPMRNNAQGTDLAEPEDGKSIMDAFAARSEKLKNGEWQEEWHRFCLEEQALYRRVIAKTETEEATDRDRANFAHFLDCEAHMDMWRELYPSYNLTNCK